MATEPRMRRRVPWEGAYAMRQASHQDGGGDGNLPGRLTAEICRSWMLKMHKEKRAK